MEDTNQGPFALPGGGPAGQAQPAQEWPGTGDAGAVPARAPGLGFWLSVVAIAGVGALLLGQAELAALASLAGLFAVSHAADLDPARRRLYFALAWIVPVTGALVFVSLGNVLFQDVASTRRAVGVALAVVGAMVAVGSALPMVGSTLARVLFRVASPSRTLRLAGRLALFGVLLYPVATLAFPVILDSVEKGRTTLLGEGSLWGNLLGLTLVALGGVGYRVRRDLRATLERLGLRRIAPAHWAVAGFGVLGLVLVNAGAEWVQRTWLPELWASDQRVNRLILADLSRWDALLLGLSAGIGEEIALRGALQPRLGILATSLVFAVLHVQYSWFGVGIILVLGLLLGTVRKRTSTSVAMLVHGLYDIVAVLTMGS